MAPVVLKFKGSCLVLSMANKLLQMTNIKQILRRLQQGESQNTIAHDLGVHKRSIRSYENIFKSEGYSLEQALILSDEMLNSIITKYKPRNTANTNKRYAVLNAQLVYYRTELKKTGVTLLLLWEEYKTEHPDGYGYSQFAFHVSRYLNQNKQSMHQEHEPGAILQLDFTGDKMHYVDQETGELIVCETLVCSLPFSSYSLAIALPSQKQCDFVSGINWMIKKLGVLPKVLKMDNLKSGVITSDRYEPDFNSLLMQLANHYGLVLKATRPRKPKDKPSVENTVCQVYRQAYARLRKETFYSLKEMNRALVEKMDEFNQKNFQGRDYSRYDSFEEERKQMTEINVPDFTLLHQAAAKVQNDYHVRLGIDKHKYSVPFQYHKQRVSIEFSDTLVRIYNQKNECIATHERVRSAHKLSTHYEHMPPNHQAHHDQLQYSGTYYVQQAEQIGSFTKKYMFDLLKSKPFEQLAYDSCKGLLSLRRNYSNKEIEQACERFSEVSIFSYKPVKNYLEKKRLESLGGAELSPSASSTKTPQQHNNLR
jgi:transposase